MNLKAKPNKLGMIRNLAPKTISARSYLNTSVLVSAPQWREAREHLVTKYRLGQTPWNNLAFHHTDFGPVCDRDVFPAFPRNRRKWAVPPQSPAMTPVGLPPASLPAIL